MNNDIFKEKICSYCEFCEECQKTDEQILHINQSFITQKAMKKYKIKRMKRINSLKITKCENYIKKRN